MKNIVRYGLAVAAFGAAIVGTQTANGSEYWVSSGWLNVGNANNNFGNTDGYGVVFSVGSPGAPNGDTESSNNNNAICVQGATNSGCQNCSFGPHAWCPNTHLALTGCNDGTFLTGNGAFGWGDRQFSNTTNTGGPWSGYWSGFWTSAGTDIGICPSSSGGQIQGGVWVYHY